VLGRAHAHTGMARSDGGMTGQGRSGVDVARHRHGQHCGRVSWVNPDLGTPG
jgi:hypothetical protein